MTPAAELEGAYRLHYSKRFHEAVAAYRRIRADHPDAPEAALAARQLENLKDFDLSPDGSIPRSAR